MHAANFFFNLFVIELYQRQRKHLRFVSVLKLRTVQCDRSRVRKLLFSNILTELRRGKRQIFRKDINFAQPPPSQFLDTNNNIRLKVESATGTHFLHIFWF